MSSRSRAALRRRLMPGSASTSCARWSACRCTGEAGARRPVRVRHGPCRGAGATPWRCRAACRSGTSASPGRRARPAGPAARTSNDDRYLDGRGSRPGNPASHAQPARPGARRCSGCRSLAPLSRLFYLGAQSHEVRRASRRDVRARAGAVDGQDVERSWHLLAEGDDGPYIPSMAVEIVIRKLLGGTRPAPGARAATNALALSDYDASFASRTIYTGSRNASVRRSSIARFSALPSRRCRPVSSKSTTAQCAGRGAAMPTSSVAGDRLHGWSLRSSASRRPRPPCRSASPSHRKVMPSAGCGTSAASVFRPW